MKGTQFYIKSISLCIITIVTSVLFSCTSIHEDLEPCKSYLQFKYDYNMLYADAFSSQVDKVEVFIFDADGLFVKSVTQEGEPLKQNNYMMELQLTPGNYTAITWAGRHDSFDIPTLTVGSSTMSDLTMKLRYDNTTKIWNTKMEDVWYGAPIAFTFNPSKKEVVTIPLIKNTNHIRVIMKNLDAKEDNAVDAESIDVKLTASNAYYDYKDQPITAPVITYTPYFYSGNTFESAVAELNTVRLFEQQDVRLSLCDKLSGKSILGDDFPDLDLKKYLLLTKMEYDNPMSDQEYLDREYDWKIFIFYRKQGVDGKYLAVRIMVNDWIVWKQDVDM